MRDSRRGFTLIELLVVIVIIGILAAIAIPKFASTKDRAKLASLKSDLGNIRTAQEAYYSSYGYYAATTGALTGLVNPNAPIWVISGGGTTGVSYTTTVTNNTISGVTKSCTVTFGGSATNAGDITCP